MSEGYQSENTYIENDYALMIVVDMAFGITRYVGFDGTLNATENKVKSRIPYRKAKLTKLVVKPRDNTLNGNCVVTTRKNAGVTTQTVTIAGGVVVESSSTNEVEVTDTDDIDIEIANAGAAGAITLTICLLYKVLNKA